MMEKAALSAALLGFALSAVLGAFLIPYLRSLKLRQTEREEGVQAHLKKAGTPTMGGIIFLLAIAVASLVFLPGHPRMVPVLILTLGFGLIGFLDDYLKVVKHRSDGLFAWQKFLLQLLFTTAFVAYIHFFTDISLKMRLPLPGGASVDPGIWAVPVLYFAVIGTVNGVNFTDGLDGLASTVTLVVAIFLIAASEVLSGGVSPLGGAVAGALLGFLLYNAYPARVFMGDTGSLALGGFVAGMAYVMELPLFIPLFGIIYLVEVLSVMIQVSYFKATHGKRIFKMAPIHHHFELCGWSETRVVAVFAAVTAVASCIGLWLLL